MRTAIGLTSAASAATYGVLYATARLTYVAVVALALVSLIACAAGAWRHHRDARR